MYCCVTVRNHRHRSGGYGVIRLVVVTFFLRTEMERVDFEEDMERVVFEED